MTPARFDLLGIGNAIVDVTAPVDHRFLSHRDLHPGSMSLVDEERAAALRLGVVPTARTGGGSAANTCAVAAALGLRVAFLGKVAEDADGRAFRDDMAALGIHFPTPPLAEGAPTAQSLVMVTPDGQRTMATHLGAAVAFGEHDLDEEAIADAAVLYLEGYLFDPPASQRAFRRAARLARQAGRRVALSLSDPFCVDRHRAAFRDFLSEVDLLFANETEITALYETNDWESAVEAARACVSVAALTRSERGSVVVRGAETWIVPAIGTRVVDTTGAGDAYAGGFLAAYTAGRDLECCGQLGAEAAARIISDWGARPGAGFEELRRIAAGV